MGDLSKNFSRSEFTCKCGCGFDNISINLVNKLQNMRDAIGKIVITSGCRCPDYNDKVGGVKDSAHIRGLAVDITCFDSRARYYIVNSALDESINRVGIHRQFVHLDIDENLPIQVMFLY